MKPSEAKALNDLGRRWAAQEITRDDWLAEYDHLIQSINDRIRRARSALSKGRNGNG